MGSTPRDAKKELLELDDPVDTRHSEPVPASALSRPTVPPNFDPLQYAEESEIRERMPTVTDEIALEHARIQSLPSSAAEIDLGEQSLDSLGPEEQIAILRSALAPLTRVPTLAKPMTELGGLLEDPKTAYVLGFVDGILPLETIIEVTGLPELDTLIVLDRMVSQSIVLFRPPASAR